MNNSFAFHFTLFVMSHLFSQLFWQAPSCLPFLHTPWLSWCVCLCVLCPGAWPGSACWNLQPPRLSRAGILLQPCVLSGLQLKPGLNPNPCYSLGRDEGVGSLRAQIFKFLQRTKTFQGLMYLGPKQHTTLVALCQENALMNMGCEKQDSKLWEGTKRNCKSKVMLGKSNCRCHSR